MLAAGVREGGGQAESKLHYLVRSMIWMEETENGLSNTHSVNPHSLPHFHTNNLYSGMQKSLQQEWESYSAWLMDAIEQALIDKFLPALFGAENPNTQYCWRDGNLLSFLVNEQLRV